MWTFFFVTRAASLQDVRVCGNLTPAFFFSLVLRPGATYCIKYALQRQMASEQAFMRLCHGVLSPFPLTSLIIDGHGPVRAALPHTLSITDKHARTGDSAAAGPDLQRIK